MTDDDRRDAKAYADKNSVTFERIPLWNRLFNAYAAACEAKNVELINMDKLWHKAQLKFEAERARSAKLLAALDHVRGYLIALGSQGTAGPVDEAVIHGICDTAITEYEKDKHK